MVMKLNDSESKKPLYDYKYVKDERLGFTIERDLKVLRTLYPEDRKIKVTFSAAGEAHFVIINE